MFPTAQAAAAYSLVETKISDRLFLLNTEITARVGRNGRQCVEAVYRFHITLLPSSLSLSTPPRQAMFLGASVFGLDVA
ncbi:hypothetical protein GYMLUDRAFT_235938 [Collybiopsis luxurians FD-317 M1]|nr:hypothetical protein GYMLUDRAFT_235938 [Collybiopsis luxurians FD-317 M1]